MWNLFLEVDGSFVEGGKVVELVIGEIELQFGVTQGQLFVEVHFYLHV